MHQYNFVVMMIQNNINFLRLHKELHYQVLLVVTLPQFYFFILITSIFSFFSYPIRLNQIPFIVSLSSSLLSSFYLFRTTLIQQFQSRLVAFIYLSLFLCLSSFLLQKVIPSFLSSYSPSSGPHPSPQHTLSLFPPPPYLVSHPTLLAPPCSVPRRTIC